MSLRGRYFDGRQSTGFDVEIDVDDAHLFIRFSDGKETLWPLKQISVLQEPLPPWMAFLFAALVMHTRGWSFQTNRIGVLLQGILSLIKSSRTLRGMAAGRLYSFWAR